jgi:hypothetical protein
MRPENPVTEIMILARWHAVCRNGGAKGVTTTRLAESTNHAGIVNVVIFVQVEEHTTEDPIVNTSLSIIIVRRKFLRRK